MLGLVARATVAFGGEVERLQGSVVVKYPLAKEGREESFMRFRWNILIIAGLVFLLGVGIIVTLLLTILQGGSGNDFVVGALIGLLGTEAITSSRRTTLLSDLSKPEGGANRGYDLLMTAGGQSVSG